MITKEEPAGRKFPATRNALLISSMALALFMATLTLWIPAYWPVALFEIAVLLVAGGAVVLGRVPAPGTHFPLLVFGFIVLWGCFQLITDFTINRFATERATLQWLTWAAVYYAGVSLLKEEALARRMRTIMVWFGFVVSVEAILQAYLSPGKVYGLFETGYHDFVMGPIVYHTHFAVFIEVLLPVALFLALSKATRSYTMLGVSAVLLTALVVSASRGGLVIAGAEVIAVLLLSYLRKGPGGSRIPLLALLLAGLTALLTVIVGFETASQRFSTEPLSAGRLQFAISTLHMIAVHPWVGWGLGCWPSVYPAFATFDAGAIVNQAHCDWLQWTAEGGLPVGLAMVLIALWATRPALRSIWGIGVIAVFVHAVFDYPFSRPAVGAWPILMLAMTATAQHANHPATATQGPTAEDLPSPKPAATPITDSLFSLD
jgi:O-antigen ligase